MIISQNGEKHGLMTVDEDNFELFDIGGNINVLTQEDSTTVGRQACGNIDDASIIGDGPDDDHVTGRTGCEVVDILVLFTPAANGVPGSNTSKAQQGVDHLNQVLSNSHVFNFKANLVGTVGVGFVETANAFADVTTLATGTTIFELSPGTRDVLTLRDDFDADLVVMLTNGNYSSGTKGIAAAFGPVQASAFALVEKDNIGSFTHEVGHLFGCRHETCNFVADLISTTALCDDTAGPDHPHFFKTGCWPARQKRRTEMWSFSNGPGNRIPYFSNPNVEYGHVNKKATGTTVRNNASRMRAGACTVSAFEQSSQPPLNVIINGDMFVCPCRSTLLQAVIFGGANGTIQYEWRTSSNGISYGSIVSTSSSYGVTAPCTIGEGIFVKVTATSSTSEVDDQVFYVEAKDPPYPGGMDCGMHLVGNTGGNNNAISISPNPITDKTKVTYTVDKAGIVSLSLFDYSGSQLRVIENTWKDKGQYETEVDTGNLHSGAYFVRLQTNGNVASEKLTKVE